MFISYLSSDKQVKVDYGFASPHIAYIKTVGQALEFICFVEEQPGI